MKRLTLIAITAGWAIAAASPAAEEWPQFRGPTGQGVAASAPVHWSEELGIRWKTAIPGRGWSSPVAADGRIWLTSARERKLSDEQLAEFRERMKDKRDGASLAAVKSVDLVAIAIDAQTGAILQTVPLFHVDDPPAIHGLNSYASPTPALRGGRCYVHFGTFGTACLDATTGEVLWRREISLDHIVGPGSSPAIIGERLILPLDGADRQSVMALDLTTGDTVWETPRPPLRNEDGDLRKAFCTPLAIEIDGRTQAIVPGAQWFIAYDPATGKELWRVDHGDGFSNVPRPVFDGKRLFLCTGFGQTEMVAVRADGAGDVTETHIQWRVAGQIPTQPSPVFVDERVFLVSDNGVATCLDAETGKQVWRKRLAGNYSSSPLAAGGRIYFSNREGTTTIVAAGPTFEIVAKNSLDGEIMASPAVIDGDLVLRTNSHLYRVGENELR